jgi:glycosyltransferase involved in cell wall biosynthesis
MSIVVASLVRNEIGKFLPRALVEWKTFASDIVVLDDNSTDGSYEAAKEAGAIVERRASGAVSAWGAEALARQELFELAWSVARLDDHILVLDADMVPARDPRAFCTPEADGVWFVLYDVWGYDIAKNDLGEWETSQLWYRSDTFWRAHHAPRLWSVRKTKERPKQWKWTSDRIHTGHFPSNLPFMRNVIYAPPDYGLLHMAYSTETLRQDKYVAYARVASDLTTFERQHAISILDPEPHLERLAFEPEMSLV